MINYLDSNHNGQTNRPIRECAPRSRKVSGHEIQVVVNNKTGWLTASCNVTLTLTQAWRDFVEEMAQWHVWGRLISSVNIFQSWSIIIFIIILLLPEDQAGEFWEPLKKFCFGIEEHWIEVLSHCFISSLKGIICLRSLTTDLSPQRPGCETLTYVRFTEDHGQSFSENLFSPATIIPPVLFAHFYLETCSLTERQTGEAWESSSKSDPVSETGERRER